MLNMRRQFNRCIFGEICQVPDANAYLPVPFLTGMLGCLVKSWVVMVPDA